MTNLLTVQGKMEKAAKKLQDMTDNKEAEAKLARFFSVHGWPRSLKKVEAFSTRLLALHDRLADLKAYFTASDWMRIPSSTRRALALPDSGL